MGRLPYDAWTPELIASEIEELYFVNGKIVQADPNMFKDEKVKKKFLYTIYIDKPGSKLDTHIQFYCVDQEEVEKHFGQKILSDEPLLFPAKNGLDFELLSPEEARKRLRNGRAKATQNKSTNDES